MGAGSIFQKLSKIRFIKDLGSEISFSAIHYLEYTIGTYLNDRNMQQ